MKLLSPVIERRLLRISVVRPDGTPISSDSRLAESLRAANSRLSRRPEWEIARFIGRG